MAAALRSGLDARCFLFRPWTTAAGYIPMARVPQWSGFSYLSHQGIRLRGPRACWPLAVFTAPPCAAGLGREAECLALDHLHLSISDPKSQAVGADGR